MTYKTPLTLFALALTVAACGDSATNNEPEVVGGIVDPQADALANAAPVDMSQMSVPLGGDTYRCGENIFDVQFYQHGDVMTARVTPDGGSGVTLDQGEDGSYTGGDYTLTGGPDSAVTLNGDDCVA